MSTGFYSVASFKIASSKSRDFLLQFQLLQLTKYNLSNFQRINYILKVT